MKTPKATTLSLDRGARILWFVVFAAIVCLFTFRIVRHPAYNWDIVAYVGCVHALQNSNPVEVHQQTFEELRNNVPEKVFRSLTTDRDYHVTMASDPAAFYQQLPFYHVKPLYVGLIYLLTRIGCDTPTATILASAGAFTIMALISYLWIVRYVPGPYGLIVATLSVVTPSILQSAALSTPDLMSATLLLAGIYLLLERQAKRWAGVLFVLSVLTRPDNVLFLGLLLTGLRIVRSPSIRLTNLQYIAGGVSLVALYMLVIVVSGGYGWKMLFEHTFVGLISYPAQHVPAVGLGDYIKALLRAGEALTRSNVFIYLLPAMVCVWLQQRFKLWKDEPLYLVVLYVVVASIGLRLLIHPAAFDRFFVAYFLAIEFICIVLIRRLAERFQQVPVWSN